MVSLVYFSHFNWPTPSSRAYPNEPRPPEPSFVLTPLPGAHWEPKGVPSALLYLILAFRAAHLIARSEVWHRVILRARMAIGARAPLVRPGMSSHRHEWSPLALAHALADLRTQRDHGAPKEAIRVLGAAPRVARSDVRNAARSHGLMAAHGWGPRGLTSPRDLLPFFSATWRANLGTEPALDHQIIPTCYPHDHGSVNSREMSRGCR
jgi:hypothetical protein